MFTDFEATRLKKLLDAYCNDRVPIHVRDQIVLQYRFEDEDVVLFEKRPHFRDRARWIESDVARARFGREERLWSLLLRDQHGRWHKYERMEPTARFEEVLDEINAEPTGIFWG